MGRDPYSVVRIPRTKHSARIRYSVKLTKYRSYNPREESDQIKRSRCQVALSSHKVQGEKRRCEWSVPSEQSLVQRDLRGMILESVMLVSDHHGKNAMNL
jgi:hypothetical protein